MATTITNGTVTSFVNTPQAGDDLYLASVTGLTEDSGTVIWLSVMANDLGGAAKVLYSLDDGISAGTAPAELLVQDSGRTEALSTDTSLGGAKIWITSDGKVGYDSATLSSAFRQQLQGLNPGEFLTDSFTYAVRMSSGALSWATVTVQYSGANDVPVVTGAVVGSAVEDGSLVTLNALANASDVDNGSVLTVVGVPATLPAGVSYNSATASFTLDPSHAAYQHLATGQTTSVSVSYAVSDGTATTAASVSFVVTGTNDAPLVTAALTTSAAEGAASYTANLLAGASDPDDGETVTLSVDSLTYSVDGGAASATAPGGVSVSGSTLTVAPTHAAFNHLAVGQSTTIVLNYNVKDAQGATVAQSETITITGTNDAPVVSAALTTSAAEGATSYTVNLLTGASDPDDGETATLSVDSLSYSVDGGAASATAPAGVSVSGNTLTVDPTHPALNHLAVGQSTTIVLNYNVKDAQGATVAQSATITVTGTNDAPVVSAALTTSAAEGAASYTVNLLTGASDPDDGETATLTIDGLSYSVDAGTASATAPAGVSVTGSTLTVDPTNAAFNHLAVGQSTTIVLNYNVKDAQGATVAQSETITVTGTNDAPVVSAGLTTSAAEGAASYTVNLLTGASDPDAGETATLSVDSLSYTVDGGAASATAPAGVSVTGSTLTVDPSNPAFNGLAVGQSTTIVLNYNVKDAQNATVAQTETITVTGTNDAPVLSAAASPQLNAVDENAGAPSGAVGTLVSALVDLNPPAGGLDNVSDADSGAVTGIAVTATNSANGTWWYSTDGGGTWTAVGAVSTSSALLLAADASTRVYFQGNTNFDGTVSDAITFRAWDRTAGTAGTKVDTVANGGSSAFSAATDTAAITVNAVNANPVVATDILYASNSTLVTLPTSVLLGNDTDIDGLALAVSSISVRSDSPNPLASLVTVHPNGTFSFTTGAAGGTVASPTVVTLDYTASDGAGGTTTGVITLNVLNTTSGANTINLAGAPAYQGSYIDGKAGNDPLTDGAAQSALLGGSGNDQLNGNAGNDLLIGGENNDNLSGGAGNDTLRGGLNNDDIDGGAGSEDMIDFSDAAGVAGITFVLTQSSGTTTFNTPATTLLGTDSYSNIEGVIGTGNGDTLTGSGSNDILRGGAGNDVVNGAAGTADLIDFSDGTAGINFALVQGAGLTSFNAAAAGLGTDQYQNIEGVVGTAFGDTLTGSALADTLRGGGGADTIDGAGGNDRIHGGLGADVLTGGAGALSLDTFVFDSAPNAVDTVTDFEADAGDKIELSAATFTGLATASGSPLAAAEFASVNGTGASDAVAGGVRVIYDSATGGLYYDSDGGSSANRTLFATLDNPTGTFDHNDVRVG